MSNHAVSYEELIAYAFGEVRGDDAHTVERHLSTCAECSATLARFSVVQSTVRLDAQAVPSVFTLQRVQALIAGRQPAQEVGARVTDTLRRVVAALTFDSRAGYARAGLRGASDAYVLGYQAGDTLVDLQIEPPAGASSRDCQLTGQIEGDETPVRIIARTSDGVVASESESDEHGVFLLNLMPGQYDLELSRKDEVLVLTGLTVP